MNGKADNPDSTALVDNRRAPDNEFPAISFDSLREQDFVHLYYSPIYSSISRLAGLKAAAELETLTGNTLCQLWKDRCLLLKEKRPGTFIYKVLLQQVFRYLKKQGDNERIRLLCDTLPVDPGCYLHILTPARGSLYSYLLKIKKLWKIY